MSTDGPSATTTPPSSTPTEHGYYWARFADGWEVVEVSPGKSGSLRFEWIGGDDQSLPVDDAEALEWGPPIPKPEHLRRMLLLWAGELPEIQMPGSARQTLPASAIEFQRSKVEEALGLAKRLELTDEMKRLRVAGVHPSEVRVTIDGQPAPLTSGVVMPGCGECIYAATGELFQFCPACMVIASGSGNP